MRYRTLDGSTTGGDVVSAGPLHQTVWVMKPDRSFAVVKINGSTPVEVEYQPPQPIRPVAREIQQLAQEIVDRYREVCAVFSTLGAVPHHPDHTWAVGILARAEDARKSRQPFLQVRGAKASVGEKRLSELQTVTAEMDGEQSEQPAVEYAKHLKAAAKKKDSP